MQKIGEESNIRTKLQHVKEEKCNKNYISFIVEKKNVNTQKIS